MRFTASNILNRRHELASLDSVKKKVTKIATEYGILHSSVFRRYWADHPAFALFDGQMDKRLL